MDKFKTKLSRPMFMQRNTVTGCIYQFRWLHHLMTGALLCGIFVCGSAYAKLIDIKIAPKNISAGAEFTEGDEGKPAVLVLHGFLQTHHFSTVHRLSSFFASEGYTVLSPTLILGVSKRKKSLACEAVHTHSMQDDVNEISFWLDWLKNKGYNEVILVGHSYGSLQLLIYLANNHNNIVKRVIATSLVDIEHAIGKEVSQAQISSAVRVVEQNKIELGNYRLSFCNKYVSPASAFISYARWSQLEIIALLNKIQTPLHIIMGSNDKRMSKNWPTLLKQANANVTLVAGANHFFDAEYEFDLLDALSEIITP